MEFRQLCRMRKRVKHIFNKITWTTSKWWNIFSVCLSNFKKDSKLLFHLKDVILLNSWVDYRNGIFNKRNYGDDLNYYIFRKLQNAEIRFYNCSFLSLFKKTNYLCIGSIIHKGNRHSIVWGAGCISETGPIPPLKTILAVRGPKTRELLIKAGFECPPTYGDPALLLPLIYNPTIKASGRIGIVLNVADEPFINKNSLYNNQIDDNYLIISMRDYSDYKDVINKIKECHIILSTSLHGLIISDAYNIPNIWVSVNNNKNIIGGFFKYHDYLQSVNRTQSNPIDLFDVLKNGIDNYHCLIEKPDININALIECCPFDINIPSKS